MVAAERVAAVEEGQGVAVVAVLELVVAVALVAVVLLALPQVDGSDEEEDTDPLE